MDSHDFEGPEIRSSEASQDSTSPVSTVLTVPGVTVGNIPPASEHTTDEYYQYLPLTQSISHGDLQGLIDFLNQRPDAITAWIDAFETPLLKACSCGQLEIVKAILERMTPEEMMSTRLQESHSPSSPLATAAGNGNFEIVVVLYEKNPELLVPQCPGSAGPVIPVVRASTAGHKEITRYLYDRTPLHVLMDDDGFWGICLLLDAIFYGIFDIALAIFNEVPSLAVTKHPRLRSTPLRFLALKPDLFLSGSDLGYWRRLVYSCIIDVKLPTDLQTTRLERYRRLFWMFLQWLPKSFGIKKIYDLKERHCKAHNFLRGACREISPMVKDESWNDTVYEALLDAVENGNKEFVIEIIKCNPHLLLISDASSNRNLFQLAVEHRKEKIFNLIYGLDDRKISLLGYHDEENNSILHIAAHISPREELSKASGAALKMQRELHWFKEVESMMPKREILKENREGMTPRQLFEVSHESLRKDAEEWMKYTATACSFVAALIATVTFQAIFTVPGGNDDTLGDPVHLDDSRFKSFIISDTLSFFASCTSVLIFLSILTARYSFDDFIVSLPRKMILGLSILFVSIAAMLVAFSSALFMSLRQRPMLVIPVMPLACLPAALFLTLQYPLLREIISSTYGKGLFDRDTKRWF